jgi:hypothetical protein
MKNLFDKNEHRLTGEEKSAIWREISLGPAGRKRPRRWLAPAFSAAAVTVCGLVFLFLVSDFRLPGWRPAELEVATREVAPPDAEATESSPRSAAPK